VAYNTAFTRFKSSGLAGLDCGSYLKIPRRDEDIVVTEVYDGDLEVGQCVAMVRVPAGARITGMEISWGGSSSASVLGVGDPYACGRFLGPINTVANRGAVGPQTGHCVGWGVTCGRLVQTGRTGDGCGLFYQYTCETDVLITNLYSDGEAYQGGWPGLGPKSVAGAKWTGGRLVLTVSYKQAS